MPPLVSVVIPVYNEEASVPLLAEGVAAALDGLPEYSLECLLVDDGSTDGTRAAIAAVTAQDDRFRGVHLVGNQGQSAALLAGLRRAQGEYIVTLDGDMQNDPADIPEILRLLAGADCVCGYRATRRDSWSKRVSSRVANAVRNWALGDGIRDAGCGLKGFRRGCIPHLIAFDGQHRFFAVMVRAAGLRIVECPVRHHPRRYGASKYGIRDRLWRGLYDLVGVAWLRRRYLAIAVEGEEHRA